MKAPVLQAMKEAAEFSVSLEELQSRASKIISQRTHTDAAIVTNGASSALTLGAAAIIAGYDLKKMKSLPNSNPPPEFLIAHDQRNSYDRAIQAAGAKLVNVGLDDLKSGAGVRGVELWEFGIEKSENTVGLIYAIGDEFNESHLREVVTKARELDLKVIVDAAASLPPAENLNRIPETGADLVCFSGGKAIGGPQATGILCGRKELIASALLQLLDWDEQEALWTPDEDLIDRNRLEGMPRHGIGRGMKVSKEEIVGLLQAIELFTPESAEESRLQFLGQLKRIATGLESTPVRCEIVESPEKYPYLNIHLTSLNEGEAAIDLCKRLREGTPRIFPGTARVHDRILQIHAVCLKEKDEDFIIQRIQEELC